MGTANLQSHKHKKYQQHRHQTQGVTLGDIAKQQGDLNVLTRKDRDIMLFQLRKISEDISTIDLIVTNAIIEKRLKADEALRLTQFVANNKRRITNVIWNITGREMSLKELEKEEDIAKQQAASLPVAQPAVQHRPSRQA